ncbi:sigma-70 family RNA polymerase sigma factor [Roseomonas sp. GC11]|uniref:sigma-70 family RNA polymerase sigma factor n=1 Tax=Roseomonas sp. GC11 TaxID=2950546 RepID=UPI00210AC217|nr:sigma-70 family RNA polymerase sigma factor [Roseomonas sp. GC11]MCQ4160978.1 sigma-70 family RNA polymerase sigma factor [Roseomonas sp. GC11]
MARASDEEDWADWMRAAIAGDGAAYRRVLEAVTPFLRGLARRGFARAGLSPAEAEDVVQEALLAIHLKRHTWDTARPIGPWLSAIARNKLVDALRRRPTAAHVPIDDLLETLPAAGGAEMEEGQELDRLLEQLGGRQRDIVRALSLEGRSAREAAQQFSMSEGAVRVALHRALKALALISGRQTA